LNHINYVTLSGHLIAATFLRGGDTRSAELFIDHREKGLRSIDDRRLILLKDDVGVEDLSIETEGSVVLGGRMSRD
jgi:hypothetical protein